MPSGSLTIYNKQNHLESYQEKKEVNASIYVLNDDVYTDIFKYGELGLGRNYVNGKWTSKELDKVMIILTKNMRFFTKELLYSFNFSFINIRRKDQHLDKKCISHHYDLDNNFYMQFLDTKFMAYSTGIWNDDTSLLEDAVQNKLDLMLTKLQIKQTDKVLDIGSGWGLIANYIADKTGALITGVTVSAEQLKYSMDNVKSPNIKFLLQDYRMLTGQYDKIYSIEMIEHVGRSYYKNYFENISSILNPQGRLVIQTTISTQEGKDSLYQSQYILTDIFPGGEIPKISWIMEALNQVSDLRLVDMQFIDGKHYTKTFYEWNKKLKRINNIDHKIIRAYEYYFNSCIGLYLNNILASCIFVIEKI
jgi:cyclopropane-fatty-acyl-phospholipid synthase